MAISWRVDPDPLQDGYLIIGDEGGQLVTVSSLLQANVVTSVSVGGMGQLLVANVAQANGVTGVSVSHIDSSTGPVWRVDTTPFYADTLLIGNHGFGILGNDIPPAGDDGESYLYNDLSLPADANKEVSGEIVTWPLHGVLFADEDGSFVYTPEEDFFGGDSFEYQLRISGVPIGAPVLVTLLVEGTTIYVTPGEALQTNFVSPVEVIQSFEGGVTASSVTQVNSVFPASVTQLQLVSVSSVVQANSISPVYIGDWSIQMVTCANVEQENKALGCYAFHPGSNGTTILAINAVTGQIFILL